MKFIIILVAIILLVILCYLIFKFTKARGYNPILLNELVDGSSYSNNVNEDGNNYPYKTIIDSSSIPYIENSLVFGYSFWIYIDNVGGSGNWDSSYDKEKTIPYEIRDKTFFTTTSNLNFIRWFIISDYFLYIEKVEN